MGRLLIASAAVVLLLSGCSTGRKSIELDTPTAKRHFIVLEGRDAARAAYRAAAPTVAH